MDMRYQVWSMIAISALVLLALAAFGCQGDGKSAGTTDESGYSCRSGVCSPAAKAAKAAHTTEPAEMNTAALVTLMRVGLKMQLVEARPGVKKMIPGAKLVPATSEDSAILKALPDKSALYVTYCGSAKCSASAKLAAKMHGLGYHNVIEFRQGWAGWSDYKAGKPLGEAEVNAAGLKLLMDSGARVKVFDARTGKYDDGRRVPGAGSLSPMAKPAEFAKHIPNKDQLVVTYCANLKCPASKMLAKSLRKLGYGNVIEYPHGIEGWAAAGYPVQKVK
jgi:rhodanese-related sulfurtransferase